MSDEQVYQIALKDVQAQYGDSPKASTRDALLKVAKRLKQWIAIENERERRLNLFGRNEDEGVTD
ncbi:MAG: hypothetical protein WC196_02800 [Bacilli bacterium]